MALAAERAGVEEDVEGMERGVASGPGRNVRATMTAAETAGEREGERERTQHVILLVTSGSPHLNKKLIDRTIVL